MTDKDKEVADIAFKEDRERFFKEADKYELISYLKNKLTKKQTEELEKARQEWRDMTDIEEYPDINFPLSVPEFIDVKLFSSHIKGETKKEDPDFKD